MNNGTIRSADSLHGWRKSSRSDPHGGDCLEVIDGYARGVPVRDSKTPHGPALVLSPSAWGEFITSIKNNTGA